MPPFARLLNCRLKFFAGIPIYKYRGEKMQIGSAQSHAFPSIGYAISASRGGRMSLPVSPALYIYSHFKHVSGVPASDGVQGVPISKLKILDTLIEQLTRMRKRPALFIETGDENADKRIDALIEQYQGQIRAVQAASGAASYGAVTAPSTGAVFSVSV
jgi:hypothetical protein